MWEAEWVSSRRLWRLSHPVHGQFWCDSLADCFAMAKKFR